MAAIKYNYCLEIKYIQLTDPDKDLYQYGYDYFEGTEKEFKKYYDNNYIRNHMEIKCLGITKEKIII